MPFILCTKRLSLITQSIATAWKFAINNLITELVQHVLAFCAVKMSMTLWHAKLQ